MLNRGFSLRTYADSIGVTSYLVRRLSEYPDAELEFYWPQLW
jgi:phosphatidylinositol 4-kinase